jgi:hypothetical protein
MSIVPDKEHLAGALLKPINPAASIILGVYTILWGLWVINPLWSVFARAPLYSVMATIAPEWAWGCFALFCGSVMVYGSMKRSYRALTNGAGVVNFHWTIVGLCYFLGDWQSTGGITALCIAFYAGFVYLNIRVNYKKTKQIPEKFYTE